MRTSPSPERVHVIFWTTGAGNAYVGGHQRPGTDFQGSFEPGRC